jgi:H+/Cl- antiporter ClcA
MQPEKSKTSTTLTRWKEFRLKIFFEGMVVGLLTGIVVVAYRYMFEQAEALRSKIYLLINNEGILAGFFWFIVLAIIALLLGKIVLAESAVGGSGIPQVKGMLLNQLKTNWLRVILLKFAGGIAAIFTGLSLGSGGPSVQLGATVGQGFSRTLNRLRLEEKYLITSGASAGLAAIFNAPLAGVIFALEEMHKNFSPVVLTSAMAAALSADFISQNFFGQRPIFYFDSISVLPIKYYAYLIGLGIIMGILGAVFNSTLLNTIDFFNGCKIPVVFVN